jgi:ABC-type Na+ efflux pump permease subunit
MELGQAARRPMVWILLAALVLISWGLSGGNVRISSGDSSVGGTKAWLTSEFAVAQVLSMLVLILYAFFMAVFAGMAVIRDDELEVGEIVHATPLTPAEYVWGKFLSVLAVFTAVLGVHLVLLAFFYHVLPNAAAEEIRGPFAAANYLRPALILAWPAIVFLTGVCFAVGERTRRPILVFVLPVVVVIGCGFFLWDWSPSWLDPRLDRALRWIDPTGYRWLQGTWLEVDRGVEFYNTQRVGLDGPFVLSRLAMVLAGLGAVALSVRHLAAALRGPRARSLPVQIDVPATPATPATPARPATPATPARPARSATARTTQRRRPEVRAPGLVRGVFEVARVELRELAFQPGLYIFVPLILLQTLGSSLLAVGAFDTPLILTSGLAAARSMNTLTLLVCLLLLFYTVESLERERGTGLAAIAYVTPLRTAELLFGKALANSLVGAVVLAGALLGCVIAQLVQGVAPDLVPFGIVWGLVLVPTFVVWTAFVSAVFALAGNRYTTYAIALALLLFTLYRQLTQQMNWVGNWFAWNSVLWSDMGLLEIDGRALLLNRVMVLGLAVLFTALAVKWFARRERDPAATLVRLQPRRLARATLPLTPLLVVPVVAAVLLWSAVAAGFQGPVVEKRLEDYWKKHLATWKDAPLPALVAVELDLELAPQRRWFRVAGSYTLENHRDEALARIPVTTGVHWKDVEFALDGVGQVVEDELGLYVITPPAPLAKGERVVLSFACEGRLPDGVTKNGGGTGQFILPSGVVLHSFTPSFVPVLGWMEDIGVDEDNRYEPPEYPDDHWEGVNEPLLGLAHPFSTRIRITGPAEYTYNSVGVQESESIADGRRTVTWVSDHPVNFFNIVAGRWDVRAGEQTVIHYHPEHGRNVEEMSAALDAARRWYSEWFHPYPWRELKLSEFPGLASYAMGFATNIPFSENIGFLTQSDPRSNLAFMVTAHEAAHQWWGNILVPGKGPGGNILSEGMSHFATILLFDQVKGPEQRIEFCKRIESRYGENRQVDSERPLVKIDGSRDGDTTVTYDKGGWVAWMLLNRMGREHALAGLQDFIARYRSGPDYPLLQDLVSVLREHAPDRTAFDELVEQWFFDVVVPEYRLAATRLERHGDAWRAFVRVTNAGTGRMPVEVAAVSGERFGPDGAQLADYRERRSVVELGAGEAADVEITCDFEPQRVVVDPDALVLQLRREQATAEL